MPAKGSKKRYCVHGHHKPTVGARPNGWCKECYRISYRRRGKTPGLVYDPKKTAHRSEYCPKGHHKPTVGVNKSYGCKACVKDKNDPAYWRDRRRRKGSEEAGLPEGTTVETFTDLSRLRILRLRAGLTQAQMARRIGVSHNHYARLEKGDSKATRKTLAKVMRALSEPAVGSGRYRDLVWASGESERRGKPHASQMAKLLQVTPQSLGASLRWAVGMGVLERFDGKPPVYLVTDRGRGLLGEAA